MSKPAIEVTNLAKSYRIGMLGTAQFRDYVNDWWQRSFYGVKIEPKDEIWALRDVSMRIGVGEIVGLVGKNGCGKSTLLKILSKITAPTSGGAIIRGRSSSLLEIGTGFHPELSGRENIFLNGTILGMRKKEIEKQLDQIISFSEIEKFIDTPVKKYSSGMYVRLAFAVAAHLNQQILMLDEVLAVGDHAFQQKCLGRIREFSKEGRTVLFVSHDMTAVENLCTRCIYMKQGEVIEEGDPKYIVRTFLGREQESSERRPS